LSSLAGVAAAGALSGDSQRAKMVNWAKRLLSDRALDQQMLKTFGLERSSKE